MTAVHFHFENFLMAIYRKHLQTFKQTSKKKGHRVGFRDFLPLVNPSQMEKGIASECESFSANDTFFNQKDLWPTAKCSMAHWLKTTGLYST